VTTGTRRFALSVVGYAVLFGVLFAPWIRIAADAIPAQPHADDARVIVWVIGWVAQALRTGAHVFDAPINYPAPAQLTGSEHLATSQIVAAPVYWTTGNAALATNVATMASYLLAAVVMERLVTALGAGAAVAWTAGVVFALGPLRAPANVQTLQYANVFLALVALALVRLRDQPNARRAIAIGAAVLLGLVSSYYMAVLVLVMAAAWIVLDAPPGGRARYTALAGLALVASVAVLMVASRPYFARGAALGPILDQMSQTVRDDAARYRAELVAFAPSRFGAIPLALAAFGVLGLLRPGPPRRLAVLGIACALVGIVFALGPMQPAFGIDLPLPFALLTDSPLRFFRMPERFLVLAGFGTALLAGAALAAIPGRAGAAIALITAAAVLVDRAPAVQAWAPDRVIDRATRGVYARVGAVADSGALLELPLQDRSWALLEVDAMIGETIHHRPILTGYTGYRAAHRPLLLSLIARLPDADAWDAIVDLTHVRWLLLRPAAAWRDVATRTTLRAMAGQVVFDEDGWTLVRVARAPERGAWFEALASGPQPGRTVLGAPLSALDPGRTRAALSLVEAPASVEARGLTAPVVRVENTGQTPWPVAVPADQPERFRVALLAEWRPASAAVPPPQSVPLPWDVAPADAVRLGARVGTPSEPGDYVLALRVVQEGSAAFADSPALEIPFTVAPR